MNNNSPEQVLISGGRPFGGVDSFAQGLREGFLDLGIGAEVVPPKALAGRVHDLRNPKILKILSTTAVSAAPLSRRAICVIHGVPSAGHQGWAKTITLLTWFKLAIASHGAQAVAVSDYVATHLDSIFNLQVDAVIRNPLKAVFLQPVERTVPRTCITYVGRLNRAKNMHRLMPAIMTVVRETPSLTACIAGAGELRSELEQMVSGDSRFWFTGSLDSDEVRDCLLRTKVFVSGNSTEPFGIVYLEALSQGCAIAMPACGGGLEVAEDQIGKQVFLLPISLEYERTVAILRSALHSESARLSMTEYSPRNVASAYLRVDEQFDGQGHFRPK